MTADGIDGPDAAESGKERNPRISTIFSLLSVKNEWADAGRDGRACLAKPHSQARSETRET